MVGSFRLRVVLGRLRGCESPSLEFSTETPNNDELYRN
jgi:hypothetical protein